MRPDQPAVPALAPPTARAYDARWDEWRPLCILAMNGDRSPERLEGYRIRHRDRLLHLHQSLRIPLKVIARNSIDDPRLTVAEYQSRIQRARAMRVKMDPWKNKKGGTQ